MKTAKELGLSEAELVEQTRLSNEIIGEIIDEEKRVARVTFYTHDPVLCLVRTAEETVELFGPEELDEEGREIPDELLQRFINARDEFFAVQAELKKIKDSKTD
jgi:hypothetical protein